MDTNKKLTAVAIIFESAGTGIIPENEAIELGYSPSGETREVTAVLDEEGQAVLTQENHTYPLYQRV